MNRGQTKDVIKSINISINYKSKIIRYYFVLKFINIFIYILLLNNYIQSNEEC